MGGRIQLAINVQLPRELGGAAGDAIYIGTSPSRPLHETPDPRPATPRARSHTHSPIPLLCCARAADTEGSFIIERVVEIAEAAVQAAGPGWDLSVERLLGGIRYFRVHDHLEQVALLNLLDSIVVAHPTVRLPGPNRR